MINLQKYESYIDSYISMVADDDKIIEAIKVLALIEISNNLEYLR